MSISQCTRDCLCDCHIECLATASSVCSGRQFGSTLKIFKCIWVYSTPLLLKSIPKKIGIDVPDVAREVRAGAAAAWAANTAVVKKERLLNNILGQMISLRWSEWR